MSFLLVAVTFYTFMFQAQAQNQPTCAVMQYTSDAPLATRRLEVRFPGGRQITIVGHRHGETKKVLALSQLATDHESSNPELLAAVRRSLSDLGVRLALQDFREEVPFIRSEILAKRIDFIAVENGKELFDLLDRESKFFKPMALSNLGRRGLAAPRLVDDAFLVYSGPTRYLRKIDPDLMKTVTVLPIEDDALMEQSLDSLGRVEVTHDKISNALAKDHPFREVLDKIYSNSFGKPVRNEPGNYYKILRQASEQEIRDYLLSASPQSVREDIAVYVSELRKAMMELDLRDTKKVENLMKAKGSGVYFVGTAHLKSLAVKLAEACSRSQAVPALDPAPGAGATR